MGYRSDVAYTIRFVDDHDEKNKQSFYTFLAEAKSKAATAGCFGELGWAEFEIDEARFRINFACDDVKWYPDYDDVKCHEALIELADEWANQGDGDNEPHTGIAYKFIRIGEDISDVEEKTSDLADYDWLNVNRSISRDW